MYADDLHNHRIRDKKKFIIHTNAFRYKTSTVL